MDKVLVKKICKSGDCIEEFYCIRTNKKMTRAQRKKGASDLRKIDSNFKSAVKRLARVLNCNFKPGDLLVTLDYTDEHIKDRDGTVKDGTLLLRRLKYRLKKLGIGFKYIWVIGEISTHTGLPVRPHHHIVMPAVDYNLICAQWPYGSVNYRLLKNQKDYTPLAVYLLRNTGADIPDSKKYRPSRNLAAPEWDEVKVNKVQPIKTPRNAKVQARNSDMTAGKDYVRYTV